LLPTDVQLSVSISLDGIHETHERVRGVPDIFKKVERTLEQLQELMSLYTSFSLGMNMTISRLNYRCIEDVRQYGQEKGIGISFSLAAISEIGVESIKVRDKFEWQEDEKESVILAFEELLRQKAIPSDYAHFILTWLKTGKREAKCAFRERKALLLEPNGELYACGNFEDFRMGNLLENSFEAIIRKNGKIPKSLFSRCESCVSNCYMDEV